MRSQTIYPEPVLTKDQVKSGGFILYVAGKCRELSEINENNFRHHVRFPWYLPRHLGLYQPIHRHHQEEGSALVRVHECDAPGYDKLSR